MCSPANLADRAVCSLLLLALRRWDATRCTAGGTLKDDADLAMDAAQCIGCGACVAACKNASAMLFVAAKVSHLSLMPQGQPERDRRALAMVQQMDDEGFGNCTVTGSCEAACPKEISLDFIARLNREYGCALVKKGEV